MWVVKGLMDPFSQRFHQVTVQSATFCRACTETSFVGFNWALADLIKGVILGMKS